MARTSATASSKPNATARLANWIAAAAGNRRIVLLCRLGLAAYILLLVAATHFPPRHLPRIKVPDKLGHFAAYGLLAALVVAAAMSFSSVRRMRAGGWLALAAGGLLLLACFGLCDEWTQPLVGRDFEWLDWAADLAGVATVALVAAIVTRRVKRERAKG